MRAADRERREGEMRGGFGGYDRGQGLFDTHKAEEEEEEEVARRGEKVIARLVTRARNSPAPSFWSLVLFPPSFVRG